MAGEYRSGPDLSDVFPRIVPKKLPIPPLFDQNCKKCGVMREDVTGIIPFRTRQRPFAILRCPKCTKRVFFFEAPRVPFILTEAELPEAYGDSIRFSEYIDYLIEKRERENMQDQAHELAPLIQHPSIVAAVAAGVQKESPS